MFISRQFGPGRPAVAAVALVATLTLLGACSRAEPKSSGPQVASVPTTASAGKPASTAEKTTAPVVDRQLRLGATQAEIDRAYDAYYACWTKAGVPSVSKGGQKASPLMAYKLNSKKYQKAVDSCADQEPLNPPELEPDTNPKYWDQLREEARCVKAKGLPLRPRAGSPGLWVSPPTDANYRKVRTDAAVQIQNDCEMQAYGQK